MQDQTEPIVCLHPSTDNIIVDEQIHIQWYLTDNILIHYTKETFDTNKYGEFWALFAYVYVTRKILARIDLADKNEYPDFLGYCRVESTPFTLDWFAKNKAAAVKLFLSEIKAKVKQVYIVKTMTMSQYSCYVVMEKY